MKIRYIELPEKLREGGLEKAAKDMAHYLSRVGVEVVRGPEIGGSLKSFDLVHFHGLWSPSHLRLSRQCRRLGIPYVISPHGMLEPWAFRHRGWKKWPYFHLFEKRRLASAAAILATAGAEADNIRKLIPQSKIEVLTLGIEPDVFPKYEDARRSLDWGEGERVLLYLSRVHPKKGLLELLEALLNTSKTHPVENLRLCILGDGPSDYMARCQALIDKLTPVMRIEWHPPQWGNEKWKYLQGADLFCLPTYSENFGIVLLESGIVGTPVFTTTGTPWKNIEEAGFGWVVDPNPTAYQRVLKEFIEAPADKLSALREPFAKWTRKHYAWPEIVQSYKEFYTNIVQKEI